MLRSELQVPVAKKNVSFNEVIGASKFRHFVTILDTPSTKKCHARSVNVAPGLNRPFAPLSMPLSPLVDAKALPGLDGAPPYRVLLPAS